MKRIKSTSINFLFFRKSFQIDSNLKKLIVHFLISLFCYLNTQKAISQNIFYVNGKIIDATNNGPVSFATVFIDGTTIATSADSSGYFQIELKTPGEYVVAATMVGYKLAKKNITISKNTNKYNLDLILNTSSIILDEIKIKGKRDKSWEENYKRFEKLLLANTFGKDQVTIQNKEDINFENDNNIFKAYSSNHIKIENQYLGYRLYIYLEEFKQEKQILKIITTTRFEEINSNDKELLKKWNKHRENVYLGSLRHFFSALYKNQLEQEGFDAHLLKPNSVNSIQNLSFYGNRERYQAIHPEKILQQVENSDKKKLVFQTPLEIVFTKRILSRPIFRDAPHPFSVLQMTKPAIIDSSGWITDPSAIILFGDMSRKGASEWLPYNYTYFQKPFDFSSHIKNSQVISLEINNKHYLAGDTICTKIVIQDSLKPSSLYTPFTLFIELKKDHILLKKYRILARAGTVQASIIIPDTLTSGTYTLWAYTSKMRIFSPMPQFGRSFSLTNFQKGSLVSDINLPIVNEVESFYEDIDSIKISGKVISTRKNNPIPNVQLTLIPLDSIYKQFFFAKTDKFGHFSINSPLLFEGNLKTLIKVEDKRGKVIEAKILLSKDKSYINTVLSKSEDPDTMILANLAKRYIERKTNFLLRDGNNLSEVIIKANKRVNFDNNPSSSSVWKIYDQPDGYIVMDDKKRSYPTILSLLSSHIPSLIISGDGVSTPFNYSFRGINTLSTTKSSLKPLFLVDGTPVNAPSYQNDFLLTILPADIVKIDYLTNQASLYGVNTSLGIVIAIYTNRGRKSSENNNLGNLSIEGYSSLKCY